MNQPDLTDKQKKARRSPNVSPGIAPAVLAVLFYVVSIIQLRPGIFDRAM